MILVMKEDIIFIVSVYSLYSFCFGFEFVCCLHLASGPYLYSSSVYLFPTRGLPGPRLPQLHTLLDFARKYPKFPNMALVQNMSFRIYYGSGLYQHLFQALFTWVPQKKASLSKK